MPCAAWSDPVTRLRIAIIVALLVVWEARRGVRAAVSRRRAVAASPSARALFKLLMNPEFYWHLGVTLGEVGTGLAIGGMLGLIVGLVLGANRLLAQSFESFLYYLGPDPEDHLSSRS